MNTKQTLGLIGSIILFIGVFTPILSVPILGSVNYFQNGKGDGVIIIVLAVITFFLVITKKYPGLWFTGFGSLAVLAFTFIQFQSKMNEATASINKELSGNPFRGFADLALQSVQIQWGWAVLIVGAFLVISAAALKATNTIEVNIPKHAAKSISISPKVSLALIILGLLIAVIEFAPHFIVSLAPSSSHKGLASINLLIFYEGIIIAILGVGLLLLSRKRPNNDTTTPLNQ